MISLYVPRIDVATKKLLKTVSTLDDAAAAGASLLPDWDRSMVITHLAANADGVRRAVEAARRGDTGEVYPGGKTARDAEIEAGRALPAQELKARLEVACRELSSTLGEGTDNLGLARHRPERRGPHRAGPGCFQVAGGRSPSCRPGLRVQARGLAVRVGDGGDGPGDARPTFAPSSR